ncbi:MAG TPA: murein biosynthesis integral membrane protein MurJ, partial [bacterium]|nr:murein biosynthesis integral membrane protein MurJ [bacterium]
ISRRVGTVSFYTVLSRILGLVRDAVMAWAYGATRLADAFYVAFRIPNLLRRLVAEGALTIAFVPIYTEELRRGREEGRRAASVIFTYLSLVLTAMVVLGVLFAPLIVRLIAWGFVAEPEKFNLTVYLTRLMFPYIFLISLVALAMGMLNSLKRFAAPAASPILLNIGIILGAVVLSKHFEQPAVGLALGVLLGGVAQLALQIPSLVKEGMLPRLDFNWRHPALKGMLLLMIPSAFGAAVYQLNVVVVTLLASFLPDGSVSYLWFADRISEFSLGIFSIAVATVTLPTLSDHAAQKDIGAFKETMNYSLRLAFLIDIPSAVGLYLLAVPVVSVLLQRGEFNYETTVATAGALVFFALKIPFVSGVRNLVPGFFALKDAKTPVAIACIAVVVNAGAALLLMGPLLHRGLAAALVIASATNFFILLCLFRRKVGKIGGRKILVSVGKTCAASAVMAAAIIGARHVAEPWMAGTFAERAGSLLVLVVIGFTVFVGVTRIINPEEFHALAGLIRRRRKGSLPPPSMPSNGTSPQSA